MKRSNGCINGNDDPVSIEHGNFMSLDQSHIYLAASNPSMFASSCISYNEDAEYSGCSKAEHLVSQLADWLSFVVA